MFDEILKELHQLPQVSVIDSTTNCSASVWLGHQVIFRVSVTGDLIKFTDNNSIYYCSKISDIVKKIHLVYERIILEQ